MVFSKVSLWANIYRDGKSHIAEIPAANFDCLFHSHKDFPQKRSSDCFFNMGKTFYFFFTDPIIRDVWANLINLKNKIKPDWDSYPNSQLKFGILVSNWRQGLILNGVNLNHRWCYQPLLWYTPFCPEDLISLAHCYCSDLFYAYAFVVHSFRLLAQPWMLKGPLSLLWPPSPLFTCKGNFF